MLCDQFIDGLVLFLMILFALVLASFMV